MAAILIAFFGGLLPSLIWLAFWLTEDRCQPEPKIRLILTFLAGMATVGFMLPLEQFIAQNEQLISPFFKVPGMPEFIIANLVIILWATSEEIAKACAAAFGLFSRAYDEPIDAIIYFTTAALGFAAAENALYLFSSLGTGAGVQSFLTGDLRFVGATLLHTLSSALVGAVMAIFFYAHWAIRIGMFVFGLILAIGLHVLFNFFILWAGGAAALYAFLPIWLGIVLLLAVIERVKDRQRDYC